MDEEISEPRRGTGDTGLEQVTALTRRLLGVHEHLSDDATRIALLRALEELKCAAEGAQAMLASDFDTSQRQAAAGAGIPTERRGRGIAAQVALARRESPYHGERHLSLATVLRRELPCTLGALRSGRITEWKATLVARETACLSVEHRAEIDTAIAADLVDLEAMGDAELSAAVRKLAYRLDPWSFVERRRRAEQERRTSVRPAPDTMAWFTALLPVRDAVTVRAVLEREATSANLEGDHRSKGQIMADTLVRRVVAPELSTSFEPAPPGRGLPLMVNVVVPDTLLFGEADGAGHVEGYGPVPGTLIREWIADSLDTGTETLVRRLYQKPATGDLVGMDSRSRSFTGHLAEFLRLRDRGCRTPWCDAPVRHLDHSRPHAEGGPTDAANGQGLCEACNYAKQGHGWSARPRPGPGHVIVTTTPTGHTYTSAARPLDARPIEAHAIRARSSRR